MASSQPSRRITRQKRLQPAQEADELQPQAKRRQLGVEELAYTAIQAPQEPHAVQRLLPLLEDLTTAEHFYEEHKRCLAEVRRLADETPLPLLRAVLELPGALHHLLDFLRCNNQDMAYKAAATLNVLVQALAAACGREVANAGAAGQAEVVAGAAAAAAAPAGNTAPALLQEEAASALVQQLFTALLATPQAGLLPLLQALHSSSKFVSEAAAGCIISLVVVLMPRLGTQARSDLADALLGQQQPQGLPLVLQALHLEQMPKAAAVTVLLLRAATAPERLLDALLSQQHRRGLQSLLRCLDAPGAAWQNMEAHGWEGRPKDLLLTQLLREVRHGSVAAGLAVLHLSKMPAGPGLLKQHIKVLLELVAVQGPCQALVANALFKVASQDTASLAALAALDLQPLLQGAQQGGMLAWHSMGTICFLGAIAAGRQALLPHIYMILSLVAPQSDIGLCNLAMHTIYMLSAAGLPNWAQQAVLQHSSGLLEAMSQTAHPEVAAEAGEVLLSLAGTPAGPVQLRQHIKVLLDMVAEPAPCQRHAALVLQVVTSIDDEAMAELAEMDLQPLLQAVMQGGVVAEPAAALLQMLALFDAGRRALIAHIPAILSLVAPQTSPLVCHTMMGVISVFCAAGSPDWAQQAVLQHSSGLLAAMSQTAHPGPAVAAGEVLLSLIETPDRLQALGSEQHVDALVAIVQSRAPAMTLAARALAQLATGVPAVLPLLAVPGRTAAINSMRDIQQELLGCAADSPRAKQLLELVHWLCVVSAARKATPTFIPGLVRCLQRPALTLRLFAELEVLADCQVGLVNLAPYIRHVRQALAAPQFLADASLQARLSSMEAAVRAAARQQQRLFAVVQARLHHEVTLLAGQHLHMQQPWTAAEQERVVQAWQHVAVGQQMLEKGRQWLAAVAQVNTD